jgi:hypothetical protein
MSTIYELLKFLIKNKKFFLIPSVIIIIIFGMLIVLSQGSILAPFIYTLF